MSFGTPQELLERALEASVSTACTVILDCGSSVNLRWANNTLTTNGFMTSATMTVISMADAANGTSAASLSRTVATIDDVGSLVADADAAARSAGPSPDAAPAAVGDASDDWSDPVVTTSIDVFDTFAPALGEVFGRAADAERLLYGYVEHGVTTTYLGTSGGLRLRHVQPGGHVGITGKDRALTTSAWVGQSTRDFKDVDAVELDSQLQQRLAWAKRSVALEAGRYDTILPPTAVADLMIYAYWTATAREAHEGQTVFGRPGGGTRIGERLTDSPFTLASDPHAPGLECEPFVIARSSSSAGSVFDNGLPVEPTRWIDDGSLAALIQTRQSAQMTESAFTPAGDNLLVTVDGATGTPESLIAGVQRGLLVTCLWYIREVDPQNLLLTGLTRDGVYLVENGEVTGAVNNFRFNESPIDLMGRFSAASSTVPSFSREWGDEFLRTATPALRIPNFNMSSVSQAQ